MFSFRNEVAVLLLIGAMGAPALAQTTRPAEPPDVQAARQAIAKAVAALAPKLHSPDFQTRQAAQQALASLHQAIVGQMLSDLQPNDTEQTARTRTLFDDMVRSARLGQLLVGVTVQQRKAIATLGKTDPESFNRLFSEDPEVAAKALQALSSGDPAAVDPILTWAAQSPHRAFRLAAINAAGGLSQGSQQLRDVLLDRAKKLMSGQANMDPQQFGPSFFYEAQTQGDELQHLCSALAALKDQRVLPIILNQIISRSAGPFPDNEDSGLTDAVVAFHSKRTIVTLMPQIDDQDEISRIQFGPNAPEVSLTKGDAAMALILHQTGQSLKDYGFYTQGDNEEPGFASQQKRLAARKKLRAWWSRHRSEYKGVQPFALAGNPSSQPTRPTLSGVLQGLLR